jgi:release factor glutamine methyltransferase
MTVLEVIQRSTEFLTRKGVDSPRLQVELLLAHVLKLPRLQLYLNFERPLTDSETERLRDLVQRRGRREPLQYLVGEAAFCGRDFAVTPAVLIPRPETEGLAELAWQWLAAERPDNARILDFGTGSGCLAVTLALEQPSAEIHALDISPKALEVAQSNAARHGVRDQLHFVEGEGVGALPDGPAFDLIVANPPYIPSAELADLQPEVRDHEPRQALDGGPDGLRFIRELAGALPRLKPGGRLMLEFADGQENAAAAVFTEAGWSVNHIAPDLSGTPRILVADGPPA